MGSGSETRRRNKLLPVRCTEAELAAFKAAARNAGYASVGEYVRGVLGRRRAPRRSKIELQELGRALGLMGWYGSNANQMARVANAAGDIPSLERLDEMVGEIREIRASLMRALGKRGH